MNDLEHDLSARLRVLADDLAGPAPAVSAPDAVSRYRHRRRARAGLIAVAAAVAVIAVGVPVVGNSLSSAPAIPAAPAPHTTTPPPPQTPTSRLDPSDRALETATSAAAPSAAVPAEERAALQAAAARLTAPVSLTSPTTWDQWLPAGKPYPGASTEDDMSTCPHLADGLTAALGQKMSYWVGTLPGGPVGCEWATVPLSYDGPYDYPYLISVGFLGDGTRPDQVPSYEHQGQLCPTVPVPSVDPQAVLTRCETDSGVDLMLTLPDARGAGTWVLDAQARTDAFHTADEALRALMHGVEQNYG